MRPSTCCSAPTRLTQVANGPRNSLIVCTKCEHLDTARTYVLLEERRLPCGCYDTPKCLHLVGGVTAETMNNFHQKHRLKAKGDLA